MRKLPFLVTLAFAALGASCHRVSADDAKKLLRTVEAAATTPDADTRIRLLYGGCGEASSCAGGCTRELKFASTRGAEPEQKARVFRSCFPDYARASKADVHLTADAWFPRYLGAYLTQAREKLEPEDRSRLDAAKKSLALP